MADRRRDTRGAGERGNKTRRPGRPQGARAPQSTGGRRGQGNSHGAQGSGRKASNSRQREMEMQRRRAVNGNPAKSVSGMSAGHPGKQQQKSSLYKNIGIGLCAVQLVVSMVFMVAVFMLNMLPSKYLAVLAVVLVVALGIALITQMLSKGKAVAGKIYSVFISLILIIGSYYMFKTNGTVEEISGGNTKVDQMVVAVLADDPAENIEDAASYDFGVQYALKGDEVRQTVAAINEELGKEIQETEYRSVQEQATSLHNGDVKAIIYNEAYAGILEEEFGNFNDSIKVIYTYEIESKMENKAAEVEVNDECFTVYISGIDVYGAIETNSRSDVNIMAVVNPDSHQILLVTTPRDYYVEIPGVSGGEKDKLTHAGIYGVDASMATLGALYDTEIDFYARVNFTSLVEMVDALGGIDVVSEQAFTTSEDTGLVMDVVQGENHFDGKQALAFSRERTNVDGGDFQRGKNQQAVITAMIKKAISPAILMGANGILNSISGNVDTNMTQEQIQELIKNQLDEGASWNIKSMAAEGTGDEQYCYSSPGSLLYVAQPDEASITAIKSAVDAVQQGQLLDDSEVVQ